VITHIVFFDLNATSFYLFPGKYPDMNKRNECKRDDSTKHIIEKENLQQCPDTLCTLFPCQDLYPNWDTTSLHPYSFYKSFKGDSVELTLISEEHSGFSMPFKGNITSDFGWRKYHPHYGTDIDLHTGDAVVASFDGMVRMAKYYYGYGNCIVLRHSNGLETVYAHLSKISVSVGQTISAGEIVGLGGNTGHSFGSHLHFEMRYLGQPLNTEDFIDYTKCELKSNCFILRKTDVETKYDLRTLRSGHEKSIKLAINNKSGKVAKGGIYVIKRGDTLGAIAIRNHTTVKSLCKKNSLRLNSVLQIGQKIKI
jgi:murein DD-endopeptidase MepM/ murein hydrolase activator NlpD